MDWLIWDYEARRLYKEESSHGPALGKIQVCANAGRFVIPHSILLYQSADSKKEIM